MLSVYPYKRLYSIYTAFGRTHIEVAPSLLRCFDNYLCYSSTSLANVDLLSKDKRNKKSIKELDQEKSFTVSYLMNSHGFSRERAVSIAAKAHFNDLEKPNSVIALLQSYGFTDTHIATLVRLRPVTLVAKHKSISPKLDFFLSIGMSKDVLATFISEQPYWLQRSLDNLIIPTHNFLKSFLLTDERVIATITRHPRLFQYKAEKCLGPNIKVLRELKVPESCISLLLLHFPETLTISTDEFKESVSKVLEMGFDPLKSTFVMALHAVSGKCNGATWDQCYETYSSWGWSKQDIYMAFRKFPNCMLVSRNKISRVMDFLVNKIGVDARQIANNPSIFSYSLEKRMIPRFTVIQALLAKGLVKHFMLNTVIMPPEKYFLDKFVVPYQEEIPNLYDCYKGKVGVEDL